LWRACGPVAGGRPVHRGDGDARVEGFGRRRVVWWWPAQLGPGGARMRGALGPPWWCLPRSGRVAIRQAPPHRSRASLAVVRGGHRRPLAVVQAGSLALLGSSFTRMSSLSGASCSRWWPASLGGPACIGPLRRLGAPRGVPVCWWLSLALEVPFWPAPWASGSGPTAVVLRAWLGCLAQGLVGVHGWAHRLAQLLSGSKRPGDSWVISVGWS
jgi:hypothetical protein